MNTNADINTLTGLPIGKPVESTPAAWPHAKLLVGRAVRLEALNPSAHSDDLWDAVGGMHNAALWEYLSDGPFAERSEFDSTIRLAVEQTDPVFFSIVQQETNRAIGWCSLLNIRPKHRAVEVGFLLFSPSLQRTIGATEALYLLAKYSFDELGYRRYEWKCNALNAKSRAAAERFGFIFEGTFRQHMIVKGRNRDSAWFSITADEWPGVKGKLENWLRPDNFDKDGKQRKKLADFITDGA